MNIISITREYGAGGGEVARKLAEALGWELLDRQLLHQAAEVEHVPDAELERLDEKALSMADRFRLHPPHLKYLHGLKTAVSGAAERGNVVLVGRGARHLLGERPDALHLRLVAPKPWRAQRMAELEGWSVEEAVARCTATDRIRDRFTRYFFGDKASRPAQYDLVFNTGGVPLNDVVAVTAAIARAGKGDGHLLPERPSECCAPEMPVPFSGSRRVLTLSRELGAGEQGFAPTLAERLKMEVYDRELLEQEAAGLGVSEAELEKIDERGVGIFQRFRPGSIYQRYFEALGRLMHEVAARGEVILVGRGGSRILRDDPRAFHVRLVASMPVRVRRVMEYRWVQAAVAKRLIAESDSRRSTFYESYFGADWTSPLEYDVTVNVARLGPMAVETVALAAERDWSHP
jgi:cytidylate kinase